MNDDVEVTHEERLQDLARAYAQLRESSGGFSDPPKASALAQLSIAMSLLEREAYTEEEDEESDEDEEDEEDGEF
jgi:hypothetical protein